jgi:MFS family permease
MENLDGTVIATAMPQMARSFGASPVDLNIGMTAYLLALAVFIPMSVWLADRFGARPVFGARSAFSLPPPVLILFAGHCPSGRRCLKSAWPISSALSQSLEGSTPLMDHKS